MPQRWRRKEEVSQGREDEEFGERNNNSKRDKRWKERRGREIDLERTRDHKEEVGEQWRQWNVEKTQKE